MKCIYPPKWQYELRSSRHALYGVGYNVFLRLSCTNSCRHFNKPIFCQWWVMTHRRISLLLGFYTYLVTMYSVRTCREKSRIIILSCYNFQVLTGLEGFRVVAGENVSFFSLQILVCCIDCIYPAQKVLHGTDSQVSKKKMKIKYMCSTAHESGKHGCNIPPWLAVHPLWVINHESQIISH